MFMNCATSTLLRTRERRKTEDLVQYICLFQFTYFRTSVIHLSFWINRLVGLFCDFGSCFVGILAPGNEISINHVLATVNTVSPISCDGLVSCFCRWCSLCICHILLTCPGMVIAAAVSPYNAVIFYYLPLVF